MTSSDISYYLQVRVTLKHRTTLATQDVYFTNRPAFDEATTTMYPLLLSVSELGASHDRFGPTQQTGTVVINDAMGSFGVDRKFSDLLQRYEIIDQSVLIRLAISTPETFTLEAVTTVYAGKVARYSRDDAAGTLSIEVESRTFKRKPVTVTLDTRIAPNLPVESYGKTVPLVIGANRQVQPVLITATGAASSSEYAYATVYYNKFPCGGVQKYYARDADGNYTRVYSASSQNSPVFGQALTARSGTATRKKYAVKFTVGTSDHYVITHAHAYWTPVSPSWTGAPTFTFEIYESDTVADKPGKLVATAIRSYSSQTWSAETQVFARYEEPVVLSKSAYWLAVSVSDEAIVDTVNDYWALPISTTTLGQSYVYFVDNTHVDGEEGWNSTTSDAWFWGLYGLKMTDVPSRTSGSPDENGLIPAYVSIAQQSATYTEYSDITGIDWVFEVNGLKDDGSGSVTGVAGYAMGEPNYVLEALTYDYSGGSWTASTDWDFSAYSDSHAAAYFSPSTYARNANGSTDGIYFLEEFARELMENTASRVVQRNDGKLSVYGYGATETLAARLGPDQCVVESFEVLDPSYVVNNIRFGYDRNLIYFDPLRTVTDGVPGDYLKAMVKNQNVDDRFAKIIGASAYYSGNSESLYGRRHNGQSVFNFLADVTYATNVAYFLAAQYAYPPMYVTLAVPFNDYHGIQPMQVIEVTHPSLPAYFGSSYSAKLPDYSGTLVDVAQGYTLTRAEPYRMQIEDRTLTFENNQAPEIRWRCRVIMNPAEPT